MKIEQAKQLNTAIPINTVLRGDCIQIMRKLPAASADRFDYSVLYTNQESADAQR